MKKLLLTLCLLLLAAPAWAVPAFVQSAQKAAGSVSSTTLAYTSNITAGGLKIVAVMTQSATPTSVTDPQGSYTKDYEQIQTTDQHMQSVWSMPNGNAGATTVTVTNGSAMNTRVIVAEYSGLAAANVFDTKNSAQVDSNTTLSSGSITTSRANEVLISVFSNSSGVATMTADGAFTAREKVVAGVFRFMLSDRIVSSTGSYSATPTENTAFHLTSSIGGYGETAATSHNLLLLGVGQ